MSPSETGARSGIVRVRRTGGLAGRTLEGAVDLHGDDPRVPAVRELLARVDLPAPPVAGSFPDGFTYTFEVGDRSVSIPQQHLDDDQRALADLVLGRGG